MGKEEPLEGRQKGEGGCRQGPALRQQETPPILRAEPWYSCELVNAVVLQPLFPGGPLVICALSAGAGKWSFVQAFWRGLPAAQALPPNVVSMRLVNVLYARKAISGEGLGGFKDS